jgi:hypothetical protein
VTAGSITRARANLNATALSYQSNRGRRRARMSAGHRQGESMTEPIQPHTSARPCIGWNEWLVIRRREGAGCFELVLDSFVDG